METLERHNEMVHSGKPVQNRVCIAVPMTGLLRSEWVLKRYGQIIPVNWSCGEIIQWFDTFSPIGFAVDAARNVAVNAAVTQNFEWLLFIDHDVLLPPNTFVTMNEYIGDGVYPVVSGLYAAKGIPAEPLVFRGRGNSWFRDWKRGDKVKADGVPMGCTLINGNLLRLMWEASPEYEVFGLKVRKVFETPRFADPERGIFLAGTEDLFWCDRVLKEGWLEKAGYTELAKDPYPFLVDTSLWCGHITPEGKVYWPDDR